MSSSKQWGGIGQGQKSWDILFSHPITFSFAFKDSSPSVLALSLRVAIWCLKYLEEKYPLEHFYVKWPNDLLVKRKGTFFKCGGILVNKLEEVFLVGIGLNLNCSFCDFENKSEKLKPSMDKSPFLPAALELKAPEDPSFFSQKYAYDLTSFLYPKLTDAEYKKEENVFKEREWWLSHCAHLYQKCRVLEEDKKGEEENFEGIFEGISLEGAALLSRPDLLDFKQIFSGKIFFIHDESISFIVLASLFCFCRGQ